jgi:hypothetical protein
VVAIWQLYVLGFSARQVEIRVRSGRLHRVHRGVYAVGHDRLTERGHWMAAVLACGPDALLSHRSAAGLRSLLPDGRAVIDVTVPGRSRHSRGKIVVHPARTLHADDIEVYDGIPTTSVARLLLDVAETALPRQLATIFEAAERERVLDMRKVDELRDRSRGRAGLKPLNSLIAQFEEPPPHIRSKLERRFFALCRKAGLPEPAVNACSWSFHRTRQAFERDRARDVRLQVLGFTVLRFTWRQLAQEPGALIAAVAKLIKHPASFRCDDLDHQGARRIRGQACPPRRT